MSDHEIPASEEHTRHYDIAVLQATPIGTRKHIDGFFRAAVDCGARAVIVTGFANGTVPEGYFPSIERTISEGVPVFVISDNRAEDHGPQRIKYDAQEELVRTGATVLSNTNVNNAWGVADTVQDAIEQGYAGKDLSQATAAVFGALTINPK